MNQDQPIRGLRIIKSTRNNFRKYINDSFIIYNSNQTTYMLYFNKNKKTKLYQDKVSFTGSATKNRKKNFKQFINCKIIQYKNLKKMRR